MRNFYVVFDQANMKFGFSPLINAPEIKPAIVAGTIPNCSLDIDIIYEINI